MVRHCKVTPHNQHAHAVVHSHLLVDNDVATLLLFPTRTREDERPAKRYDERKQRHTVILSWAEGNRTGPTLASSTFISEGSTIFKLCVALQAEAFSANCGSWL